MRIIVIGLLIFINIIFESTIFQYTRIFGIKPDFCLMLIVAYSILRGSSFGAFIGLTFGILLDLMYGRTMGINAITYMLTGYLLGQLHENVFKDSVVPAVIFNFLAVLVSQNIFFIFAYFTNNIPENGTGYFTRLVAYMLPQAIYTAIIGGLVYKYIYLLDKNKFMDKRIY